MGVGWLAIEMKMLMVVVMDGRIRDWVVLLVVVCVDVGMGVLLGIGVGYYYWINARVILPKNPHQVQINCYVDCVLLDDSYCKFKRVPRGFCCKFKQVPSGIHQLVDEMPWIYVGMLVHLTFPMIWNQRRSRNHHGNR